MKKYFKVINTQSTEEIFVSAKSLHHVEAWVIKNRPEIYFGMNVIEINQDKSRKPGGDFSCIAVKDYYLEAYKTNNINEILNREYKEIVKRIKERN